MAKTRGESVNRGDVHKVTVIPGYGVSKVSVSKGVTALTGKAAGAKSIKNAGKSPAPKPQRGEMPGRREGGSPPPSPRVNPPVIAKKKKRTA